MLLLSNEDVEAASRLMRLLAQSVQAEVVRLPATDRQSTLTREALVQAARRELERRRRRTRFLPEGMFGEPAWEILLMLYVEQHGVRLKIARLTEMIGLPGTTTLRWVNYLQDRHLILREEHPTDRRAVFVRLTPKAIETIDGFFSEALTQAKP